jgi:tRNA (guanine37-N1)-methyltransferase
MAVPEVLVSGNHGEVDRWRRDAAIEKTRRNRPDLTNDRSA